MMVSETSHEASRNPEMVGARSQFAVSTRKKSSLLGVGLAILAARHAGWWFRTWEGIDDSLSPDMCRHCTLMIIDVHCTTLYTVVDHCTSLYIVVLLKGWIGLQLNVLLNDIALYIYVYIYIYSMHMFGRCQVSKNWLLKVRSPRIPGRVFCRGDRAGPRLWMKRSWMLLTADDPVKSHDKSLTQCLDCWWLECWLLMIGMFSLTI